LEQDERGWSYILGARMRSQNEVKDEVLSRAGRYRVVHPPRVQSDDPSPLTVKEVWVDDRPKRHSPMGRALGANPLRRCPPWITFCH